MIVTAIVGCGRIANQAHLPALSKMDDVRIKYAVDIIPGKAAAAKEKFPKIENALEDYHAAIADPEVDVVYVLTTNFAHYTVTMDALRAGKHVFCEKPITIDYKLALEMADLAEKSGKLLNIGVCNRYNRSVEMLREWNEAGRFGKIYHVYTSFRSFRSIPGLGGGFTDRKQSGGGVLIDWGVHFLDLILYVLGDARALTVTANAYSEMAKNMKAYRYDSMWAEDTSDIEHGVNDVDDFVSGYIRTDKANISFNGAWAQNIKKEEMYIDFLGDKGGARLDYGGKFVFFDGVEYKEIAPEYDIPSHYEAEDAAFIKAVKTGEKTRTYIDRVLESARIMDALYRSSDLNKEIKL